MNWLIVSMWIMACSSSRLQKRLDSQEFDHWYALRVYMSDEERKVYLKKKTREERDTYLQELEIWDKFYVYEERIREKIVAGEVQNGWTTEMLQMAWGAPYDKQRAIGRNAVRSIKYVYKFEQHSDGSVLVWERNSKTVYKADRCFIKEVIVDDDVVAEMIQKKFPC